METLNKGAAEIASAIGSKTRVLESWIDRLGLSSKFSKAVPGQPRGFSRHNVLELAFISALVKGGAKPRVAKLFAARWLTRGSTREWFVFAAGDLKVGTMTDSPDLAALQKKFGEAATLSLVPVGAIVRMVDKLFEGD